MIKNEIAKTASPIILFVSGETPLSSGPAYDFIARKMTNPYFSVIFLYIN
jgi:hypothetical protein